MNSVRQEFSENVDIPDVIECIDCTHVALYPPCQDDPVHPKHIFVNRKNYHSINIPLICYLTLRILHVNAKFPGSCHDSYIWNNSNLEPLLRTIFNRGHEGYFLLGMISDIWVSGDSGYPLRPWLPLQNPVGHNEELYNRKHKTTRARIERCIGLLKMRFRCLLKHLVFHYAPETAMRIIKACVVLHNICVHNNLEHIPNEEIDIQELDFGIMNEPVEENVGRVNLELVADRRMQQRIINHIRV